MRIATTAPYHGWSDFRWRNPKTGTIDEKSAWIERMGEYLIGVGIYKAEQQNQNTVAIISGSPGSDATYLQAAYDLAAVLNDGENLRVLPVVGIGGPQNIRDVRALKGIDIGLTQTSILNSFRRSNAILGVPDDDKIAIVSRLFNLEAHLVVRSGSGITSIEQLRGQKVNLDEVGSGTNSSMRDVFQRLDIKIDEVNMVQSQALLKLKEGEIAATVLVAGKPADSMLRLTHADGLAFLPIPYNSALSTDFLPAELTHADYPDMIPEGQSIKTVADSAVLIAYNWAKDSDRYRRVEMFVNAFFSKIAEFQKPPHHAKWREVNLNSSLEGWNRLPSAQKWLDSHFNVAAGGDRGQLQAQASQAPTNDAALFQEFLQWKRARQAR
jgi:TRAP transporter TAXI family solute receptor